MERGIASEAVRILLRRAGSASNVSFATEIGGGVDVNVEGKISWRLAEFDYLPTYFHQGRHDNFRLGTGLVFRLRREGLVSRPIRSHISE